MRRPRGRGRRARRCPWRDLSCDALRLAHRTGGDDLFVYAHELRGHVRPVVLGGPLGAGATDALSQLGIADETLERAGKGVDLARLDEEGAHVPLHDLLVAVDVRGHDRAARGHRLEEHDAERLLPGRGRAEDVGRLVEARLVDVAHSTGKEHVADVVVVDEALELADLRPRAREDEPRLGAARLELRVRAHEIHRALAWLAAADEEDVRLPVPELREWLRVRVEVDVDAVRDDAVVVLEVA